MHRNGKAKSQLRAIVPAANQRVYLLLQLCKRHYILGPGLDQLGAHPENSAIELDVLQPGKIGMKTSVQREQRCNAGCSPSWRVEPRATGRWTIDPRQNSQQ